MAYRQLKALICDGSMPGGSHVLEQEAAIRLGMSRTPVREAMVRLREDGMVELRPRHGMRILPLSPGDMREIYQLLTSLEGTAAELVARRGISAGELAGLRDAVGAMDSALERDDLDAWAVADERFHGDLVAACGNRRLVAAVNQYWSQAHRARLLTLRLRPKPVTSNRDHAAVVQAIEAGDSARAGRVHREHRERAGAMLVEILERLRLTQV